MIRNKITVFQLVYYRVYYNQKYWRSIHVQEFHLEYIPQMPFTFNFITLSILLELYLTNSCKTNTTIRLTLFKSTQRKHSGGNNFSTKPGFIFRRLNAWLKNRSELQCLQNIEVRLTLEFFWTKTENNRVTMLC